jgi:hypothetical protein
MIKFIFFFFASQLGQAFEGNHASQSFITSCDEACYQKQGGDVPIPFSANRKVELADGETYVLLGNIQYAPSLITKSKNAPYLHIDLEVHPWLASEGRKDFPFYPLILTGDQKLKLSAGTRIKVTAKARAFVLSGKNQSYKLVMALEPLESD